MTRLVALMLAWALSAASAAPADDPLSYITAIYKVYQDDRNDSGVDIVYSRRMQALRDDDARKTPKRRCWNDRLGPVYRRQ